MPHVLRLLIAIAAALWVASAGIAGPAAPDVAPMIGTGGEGHACPGAVAPFGMVQLSPDTDTSHVVRDAYRRAAGYRYSDPTIEGFSHGATIAKLDAMFDYDNSRLDYSHAEDIAGLIGQYIHGNEPSHHVAYLYDYAGAPWRTQARLKQIVDSQYHPTPDGLAGNDDFGQMSAWLVFSARGFYPVTPGSLEYAIRRPFLTRAVLALPNGRRFTMVAQDLDDTHPYVGQVLLDGRPLARGSLRHAEIMAGGELRFVMQATPETTRATAPADRPFAISPDDRR